MPIKPIPNSKERTRYYLICYDKDGNERHDDPDVTGGTLSNEVIRLGGNGQYTDIFFISHGWKAGIPEAISQYDAWTAVMVACEKDIARLKARPQGFKPLVVGLHWPSLPFGMENHHPQWEVTNSTDVFNFSTEPTSTAFDIYARAEATIANTDEGRRAVRTVLDYAAMDSTPEQLDDTVADAIDYLLRVDVGVTRDDPTLPQDEIINTNARTLYQALKKTESEGMVSFGGGGGQGPLLGILNQLSIWQMKARARTFGENGAAKLLRKLMSVTSANTQFHLMGHSLGTVVVSSAVTGKGGKEPLPRPVNTVYLVQGAVSFWSYCKDIPVKSGTPGYYQMLSHPDYMVGPILVTHTENDTAIKNLYVLASQVSFDETVSFGITYPLHGGLGMFGARGSGIAVHDMELLPMHGNYGFTQRTFFNLDASHFMKAGNPLMGGAHNDIAHPEVAHAFWSAIR